MPSWSTIWMGCFKSPAPLAFFFLPICFFLLLRVSGSFTRSHFLQPRPWQVTSGSDEIVPCFTTLQRVTASCSEFTEYYRALLSLIKLSRVRSSFGYVLSRFTELYQVFTEFFRFLPSFIKFYRVFFLFNQVVLPRCNEL